MRQVSGNFWTAWTMARYTCYPAIAEGTGWPIAPARMLNYRFRKKPSLKHSTLAILLTQTLSYIFGESQSTVLAMLYYIRVISLLLLCCCFASIYGRGQYADFQVMVASACEKVLASYHTQAMLQKCAAVLVRERSQAQAHAFALFVVDACASTCTLPKYDWCAWRQERHDIQGQFRETANECHYDISKVLLFVAAQLIQQLISKLEYSIVILKAATYHADYVCRACFNTYNSIVMMFCRRRMPRSTYSSPTLGFEFINVHVTLRAYIRMRHMLSFPFYYKFPFLLW